MTRLSLASRLALSLVVLSVSGCGEGPPLERTCTVQFRRGDALGSGAALPVSPLTREINGAEVALTGKVTNITPDWVVLDVIGAGEFWIPKQSILFLQYRSNP